MNPLSGFSDWALALLPRLFIYPGGVWLIIALAFLRVLTKGPRSLRFSRAAWDLSEAHPVALATAWVAVSLLPLPGAELVPSSLDRFALMVLPAISLTLAPPGKGTRAEFPIVLALLAPLAGARSLLDGRADVSASAWLSLIAVMVALPLASPWENLAGQVRSLAWLGLVASPVWALEASLPLPGFVWASGFYLLALAVVSLEARLLNRHRDSPLGEAAAWAMAVAALLVALL